MNSRLFLLAALALATAACQQEKPATIEAAVPGSSEDRAVVVADTVAYHDDARRLTDRVAADLNVTDAEAKRRLEYTYYTRNRRLGEIETRYSTDTVGRYTALRTINDDTDREVRTIFPDQYNTYESRRGDYYGGSPYTSTTTTTTTTSSTRPARRGPRVVSYEKDGGETKIEYSNGTTVKIDKDGDRKVKYADGTKVKTDADDGERKVKR